MPVAVAIGGQPVIPIVSCVQLPPYVNEVEVAGALQGAPIPLVKCETIDLEVPATAEIILEGRFCLMSEGWKDRSAKTRAMRQGSHHRSRF